MRATGLLGPILSALVSWYPLDQFAPLGEPQAAGAANGSAAAVHLEPWVMGASLEEAKKWSAPRWHVPSPEVRFSLLTSKKPCRCLQPCIQSVIILPPKELLS